MPRNRPKQSANPTPSRKKRQQIRTIPKLARVVNLPLMNNPEEPEYTELDQAHEQIAELQNALSVAAKGNLAMRKKQKHSV